MVDIRFDGLVTLYAANLPFPQQTIDEFCEPPPPCSSHPQAHNPRGMGANRRLISYISLLLVLIRSASEVTVTLSKPWRLSPCEGIKGTGENVPSHNLLPRRNIRYYNILTLGHLSSSTVCRLLLPATNSFSAGLIRSYHVLLHQITRRQSLRRFSISHNRIKASRAICFVPQSFCITTQYFRTAAIATTTPIRRTQEVRDITKVRGPSCYRLSMHAAASHPGPNVSRL